MKLVLLAFAAALALASTGSAVADDQVSPFPASVIIGQQFRVTVQVEAPSGAEVEINTVAEGWNGVEVVRVENLGATDAGAGQSRHTFTLTLAAFAVGPLDIQPTVLITEQGVSIERDLPVSRLLVASTLPPNAPLRLTPLAAPGPVSGAQSPWLVPIVVGAVVLAGLALLALAALLVRWWLRRPRPARELLGPGAVGLPDFGALEASILADPIGAYRAMAALVRETLARRYGFPARALTTLELARRMEAEGVDRWEARLVGGLLEECDAVVYAGYLPAPERRAADLTMAMQVLEGAD